jgi:hypothetical protein
MLHQKILPAITLGALLAFVWPIFYVSPLVVSPFANSAECLLALCALVWKLISLDTLVVLMPKKRQIALYLPFGRPIIETFAAISVVELKDSWEFSGLPRIFRIWN